MATLPPRPSSMWRSTKYDAALKIGGTPRSAAVRNGIRVRPRSGGSTTPRTASEPPVRSDSRRQTEARQGANAIQSGCVTSIAGTRPVASESSIRAVLVASFIGTAIEWYDFFLYGTAAALVFSRLFFPNVDPLIGTLSSFATFAVGFGARPLGGIIFGHFGDRVGRK